MLGAFNKLLRELERDRLIAIHYDGIDMLGLIYLASLLRAAGGVPAYGNQRAHWDAGSAQRRVRPNQSMCQPENSSPPD